MGQMVTRVIAKTKLSKREQLIVLEIDRDKVDSASGFVEYMSGAYGFSKSSLWYNLKGLKERKLLDFASKDEPGKFLALSRQGLQALEELDSMGVRLQDLEREVIPNDLHGGIVPTANFILNRTVFAY